MTPTPPETAGLDGMREALEPLARWLAAVPEHLANLPLWEAALLVPLGLVSLLYGLRLVKGMVIVYAAMAGVIAGQFAAAYFQAPELLGMVVGALIFGVLAWPLLRAAVGLFGGLAAGLVAALVAYSAQVEPLYVVAAAAGGFFVGLVLAVLVFRIVVIFMTSVLGAHLVVIGVVSLAMSVPSLEGPIVAGIQSHRFFVPVLVGVPAAIGALYQAREGEHEKPAEKKKE